MTDPPWAELPLTSIGHRPLRVRGQALTELPLLLLGHIQTKVLQNLQQKQEAFKKENTGKAPLWGKHWEDTWCWVSAGSISQRSRLGLDFQSLLSCTCTEMSAPEYRFTSLQEHFICNQICSSDELSGLLSKARGVLTSISWQELSLSLTAQKLFGTRKIKAVNRVFPMERGDIQTFCSSTTCFALSLLLVP